MVSTTVCGAVGLGSSPNNHPLVFFLFYVFIFINDPTYGGVFYCEKKVKICDKKLGIVPEILYVYTVMRNEPPMNEPLLKELRAFPSVQIGYTEGGWVYFQASDNVIAEISQKLRRRVQRIVRNEYRLSLI